jgi:hypothetical protein
MKPNLYQLAAEIKAEGRDKYIAWDQYIIRTGLKPEVDAKEFYAIYEKISPAFAKKPNVNATHHDNYFGIDCEMTTDEFGVISIVWSSGLTGSYPPCYPPEEGRFTPLESPDGL